MAATQLTIDHNTGEIIDNGVGAVAVGWYDLLIEDCKAIITDITEAIFNSRWALVEGYHQLGERIVTENNLDRESTYGKKIFQGLGKSLRLSKSTLYYAVQFYEKYPDLSLVPEGKNISWNKIITKYLPAKIAEQGNDNGKPMNEKNHLRLYKGDMEEVLAFLPDQFDLVVTDPPYGVTNYEWDQLNTSDWLKAIIPHLADEYNIFWFCSPKFAADIELIFRVNDLPIQSRIVWHRRNMAMGSQARNRFIDTWEMILHAGNRELNFPKEWSDAWFDVQTFAVPQTNFTDKKLHPTQKPEALIQRLVEFGSFADDTILDPFAGSGTAGVVCPDNRTCVMIEKEEDYTEIIEDRLGIKRQ